MQKLKELVPIAFFLMILISNIAFA